MKKRRPNKPHKENIFLFPNVDKLLMDKGLESLKNKKFNEAIEFLEKAQELDPENEEIGFGIIIAYIESGQLVAAKQLVHQSLQKGIWDYFQLIDLYIMILLQLSEYEEIVSTIEALLDEKEIPIEKLNNFTKIFEFSKRKLENEYELFSKPQPDLLPVEEFNLFQYDNLNDQFMAVARLSHMNARTYLREITQYLQSDMGHPFVKTMLLQLLKEQEVSSQIEVLKFGQYLTINPIDLLSMEEEVETIEIIDILKNELEHENPTLYVSIKEIVTRHTFILFPVKRNPANPNIWAAAYHFIALEYYGVSISLEKMAAKYLVESLDVSRAIAFIRELEEISSPIL